MTVLCPVTVIGHEHSTSEGLLYQRRSIYRHHIDGGPQEFTTMPGDRAPKMHTRYLRRNVRPLSMAEMFPHCYATRIQLVYLDRKMMDLALG